MALISLWCVVSDYSSTVGNKPTNVLACVLESAGTTRRRMRACSRACRTAPASPLGVSLVITVVVVVVVVVLMAALLVVVVMEGAV
jgi:hypothetical protein